MTDFPRCAITGHHGFLPFSPSEISARDAERSVTTVSHHSKIWPISNGRIRLFWNCWARSVPGGGNHHIKLGNLQQLARLTPVAGWTKLADFDNLSKEQRLDELITGRDGFSQRKSLVVLGVRLFSIRDAAKNYSAITLLGEFSG